MGRKRRSAEEVINELRQAHVELCKGRKVPEVRKARAIHAVTYYPRRREYGGLKVHQAKRMKGPEEENARLNCISASSASSSAHRRARSDIPSSVGNPQSVRGRVVDEQNNR